MKKVFLSYHFDPEVKPIISHVRRLAKSHDLLTVDGERLAGQPLTDSVSKLICSCDAMIVLLSKREDGQTNDWVNHERTTAYNMKIPFIALVEQGVVNNGPFEAFEFINYKPSDLIEPLLRVSETIYKWKLEIGNMVEAHLEPDKIVNIVRNNFEQDEVVRYRFFDERTQWSEWKRAIVKPTTGGVSLFLKGVKKDSEIQVQVTTNQGIWKSAFINQNLRIPVS